MKIIIEIKEGRYREVITKITQESIPPSDNKELNDSFDYALYLGWSKKKNKYII
jgi:hypothetical protein